MSLAIKSKLQIRPETFKYYAFKCPLWNFHDRKKEQLNSSKRTETIAQEIIDLILT